MMKNLFLTTFSLFLFFTSCTTDNNTANLNDDIAQQIEIETQRWKDNYTSYSLEHPWDAFEVSSQDFNKLITQDVSSIRFRMALDEHMQLKAYVYSELQADGLFSQAELSSVIIAKAVNKEINADESLNDYESSDKNTIIPQIAYNWNSAWINNGMNWIQQEVLYGFVIPVESIEGVMKQEAEKVVFYLGLSENEDKTVEAKIILFGEGSELKDGSDFYDYSNPIPPG